MKKSMLCTLMCIALASSAAFAQEEKTDSVEGFQFTDVKTVKTTGVKNQNKSGTCWCFSATSFIEDEVLRNGGDSLHLSEMYTVRNCYRDKADRYVRYYGDTNFSQGGGAHDVIYSIINYGIMPDEVYAGLNYGTTGHEHSELESAMKGYLNAIVKKPNGKISTAWREGLDGILDAYFGEVPATFEYNGKTYTPQSYAKSLGLDLDNYIGVTSFTHHPYYEGFILEVPDNWLNYAYMNVPMEEMKAIVDNAIEQGYPVVWGADVSERGFKWYDGVALMPKAKTEADLEGSELARWVKLSARDKQNEQYDFSGPVEEIVVTQEMRQEMYDNQETTDDHGMEIVGIATDQNGNRYYKVKNSWDTTQKYGGYLYVSEPYFLAKTMDIYVNKNAVPKDIAKKFKK